MNSTVSNRQVVEEEVVVVAAEGNHVLRDADRVIMTRTRPLADTKPASSAIAIRMTSAAKRWLALSNGGLCRGDAEEIASRQLPRGRTGGT